MKNSQNYFLLSALFLIAFLVVQFTDIYGDSKWFKVFALIVSVSFLVGGITQKRRSK